MPTYDYACRACGHEFELFQSMKEAAKRKCPSCGKNALERLIGTGSAVLFKGGGFYQTDYRSDSYQKSAKSESEAKPSGPSVAAGESSSSPAAVEKKPAASGASTTTSESKPEKKSSPSPRAKSA